MVLMELRPIIGFVIFLVLCFVLYRVGKNIVRKAKRETIRDSKLAIEELMKEADDLIKLSKEKVAKAKKMVEDQIKEGKSAADR